MLAEVLSNLANKAPTALLIWPIKTVAKSYFAQRRADRDERIKRSSRYVRHDLETLRDLLTNRDHDREEVEELKDNIRAAGIMAHEVNGVRGMHHLLRAIVKAHEEQSQFYETKIDKIWDLIGYENGKSSRRGVWVA